METDYKKLYMNQKVQSIKLELDALSMRFSLLQKELPLAIQELTEYEEGEKKE